MTSCDDVVVYHCSWAGLGRALRRRDRQGPPGRRGVREGDSEGGTCLTLLA